MILIIGGAYQGKLEYAREQFNIAKEEVFRCSREEVHIDFSKRLIADIDEFVYACVAEGVDARKYLAEYRSKWEDSIFILNDVSCGIVPMEPIDRAYREAVGRTAVYLGGEAVSVIRVFAGLPMHLK